MSNSLARSYPSASLSSKRSKYRLLGLVGQGQFGRVFCAAHRKNGRLVALKELDHQRFPTHKFLRELRFLLSLQHSNIVTCQALEHTRTGRYLVMDYCEGGTLRSLMEADAQLTLGQGVKLIMDVLMGLAHAHGRGIVHCDIKPENILLSTQPSGWIARISDFGIAKLSQELGEETGNTGSPAYMAPERFYGQYSHSSDLYAVGVLFFELLLGYRPFSGTPTELMAAHLNQVLKLPEVLPPAIARVLLTALQKLPARRFASAADMLTATQAAIAIDLAEREALEALELPLIKSVEQVITPCAFSSQAQRDLSTAVTALASTPQMPRSPWQPEVSPTSTTPLLYRNVSTAEVGRLDVEPWSTTAQASSLSELPAKTATIELTEPLQALFAQPDGCFAIASHSIQRLQLQPLSTTIQQPILIASEVLARFETPFVATVAAQGRWWAAATNSVTQATGQVLVGSDRPNASSLAANPITFACQSPCPTQIFALDARHLVVLSPATALGSDEPMPGVISGSNKPLANCCGLTGSHSTLVEGFTRRGTQLGSLLLPVALQHVIPSMKPYRLLAIEANQANSVLLIDLKPLRVQRIRIKIQPTQLAATVWGYILADAQGQIILLDDYGQWVGQINAPSATDLAPDATTTAIAAVNSSEVLLATWSQARNQGRLYTLDLRSLDIDFLF